jgi:DNA-binding MarR family transcriptional regulator
MVTAGAITNRIDRLVAKDLVTRDLDPANRRAVIIALTTKGRRLIDKAVVAHLDNEQRLLAHLSAEDQERLATLLRDLLIALDDTPPAPSAPERP